jgi:hypothetical protein
MAGLSSKIISPQELETWFRENGGLTLYQQGCRIKDPAPYYRGIIAFRLESDKMQDPDYRQEALVALEKWQEMIFSVLGPWNTRKDRGTSTILNPQSDAGRQDLWTLMEVQIRMFRKMVEEADK